MGDDDGGAVRRLEFKIVQKAFEDEEEESDERTRRKKDEERMEDEEEDDEDDARSRQRRTTVNDEVTGEQQKQERGEDLGAADLVHDAVASLPSLSLSLLPSPCT